MTEEDAPEVNVESQGDKGVDPKVAEEIGEIITQAAETDSDAVTDNHTPEDHRRAEIVEDASKEAQARADRNQREGDKFWELATEGKDLFGGEIPFDKRQYAAGIAQDYYAESRKAKAEASNAAEDAGMVYDYSGGTMNLGGNTIAKNVVPLEDIEVKPGYNAPIETNPFIDPNAPETVKSPSEALARADAGDEKRTDAANTRMRPRVLEGYRDTLEKGLPKHMEKPHFWSRSEQLTESGERWKKHQRKLYLERFPFMTKEDMQLVESGQFTRETYEQMREEAKETAAQADKEAEAIEEWAGILHQNPVSEEYQKAHPDFHFGPRSMIELEKSVADDAENLEGDIEKLQRESEEIDSLTDRREIIRRLEGLGAHIDTVKMEQGATGEDYNEALKELFKKANESRIAGIKERANERKQVLEDVKSGKASQEPEQSSPEQLAA